MHIGQSANSRIVRLAHASERILWHLDRGEQCGHRAHALTANCVETVLILTGMALCAGALAQFVKLVQRLMEGTRAAS